MFVRTYGRRSRDCDDDGDGSDSFSLSQENPSTGFHDFHFSSQESSSFWPSSSSSVSSFDPDPYAFNSSSPQDNLPQRKSKKQRSGQSDGGLRPWVPPSLMEAQEFGEMMEHDDEVNFAVDGLRKGGGGGGGVRIRRASLLSLLSICGTAQQRRNLRAQGTVKAILDAVLGLSFDDAPSNLAAATLVYVLTSDGHDDQMLESTSCIRFLLKLLKPVLSVATEDKTRNLGSKLLGIRRNLNVSRDTGKLVADSGSSAIIAKVEEILMSCKEVKSQCGFIKGIEKPESMSKFVALLTMEKACLSKISPEDTMGVVRKMDGNSKEKLRQLGGLDAVFEVAMNCYSAIEISENQRDIVDMSSLVMLLKCLKIMENATFMSKENQDHFLAMRKNSTSHGCRISFTKLIISVIKILSGLYLRSIAASNDIAHGSDGVIISVSSSESDICTAEGGSQTSCKSTARLVLSASREDNHLLKMRVRSSMLSSSSGETSRSVCNGGYRDDSGNDSMCELFDSQDPFAFDEEDLEPSKWDSFYVKPKKSRSRAVRKPAKQCEPEVSYAVTARGELSNPDSSDSSQKDSSNSSVSDEELSTLVSECLLTAVKVLMNSTNENPVGCRQVGACRGLEAMSSLIADHFPSFDSSTSLCNGMKEGRLTDQELDFLVAILGLLVNLVEKDGQNRSRLASASISLANSEDKSQKDVIPVLCSIFLAHRSKDDDDQSELIQWDDEAAMLEGEKEAEKTIVEAYAALLLAFLSTESKRTRESIADCLPDRSLSCLVPVLERFVAFHLTLNMISPETHAAVNEVIESCRLP
ncbi:Wings apart-like protein 1 [Linum perenne]